SSAADEIELFYEVKLLVRQSAWGRSVQLDQWTGGRVRMTGSPARDGATAYTLTEVLESPWTFRWYPTKDEVKLGAAVWVERPAGHPYDAVAPELEALARDKYALWWDADSPVAGPLWSEQSGRFWSRVHAGETDDKDALPADPTYGFHVLGPLDGRFGFKLRDGVVVEVGEWMSTPWLPDGWARALDGEPVTGYGYWERKRPHWEPRTYETFAAALTLLGPAGAEEGVRGVMRVLAAMQPLAERIKTKKLPRPLYWREQGELADEVQILLRNEDESFKAWVRVGYRANPRRTP
ncbi:MAG: hypothetical protein GTO30_12505, partial [Acidobacteria bacterium]|nr:hypothetical protein [Acidobacteriota bacterium]NIQ86030.1 hypothetical protein [Acidobacteriota bacterium]